MLMPRPGLRDCVGSLLFQGLCSLTKGLNLSLQQRCHRFLLFFLSDTPPSVLLSKGAVSQSCRQLSLGHILVRHIYILSH